MPDVTASRTLVKSAPELWTECSDANSLSRHLDRFGEIRITRLEPETAVAWEGEHASGTVRLEPSGWGTRVVLTATPNPAEETPPPASEPAASVVDPAPPVTKPSTVAAAGFPDAAARPGAPDPPEVVDAVADVAPPVVELPEPESALEAPLATAASADVPRKGFFNRLRSMFSRRDVDVVVPQTPGDEPYEPDPVAVMVEAEPRAGTQDSMSAAREWAVAGREPLPATSDPVAATPEPTDPGAEPLDARAALDAALDSLGQAHHRPFSRS